MEDSFNIFINFTNQQGEWVDKEDKNVGIPDCGICGRLEMGGGGDMIIGITTKK